MNDAIQLLDGHQVDSSKWDQCLVRSQNSLIYGLNDYLNYTTDNWKAVIFGDYDAIMPIPWRKKLGITYSYNVPFIQQLGIFSPDEKIGIRDGITALTSVCSYGDYYFNFANEGEQLEKMTNMILELNQPFAHLSAEFSADALRNVQRAQKQSLIYEPGEMDEAVDLFRKLYRERLKISEQQYQSFTSLCRMMNQQFNVVVRKVINASRNTLAIMLMLKFQNRLYNMMNSTVNEGRKAGANHFLFYSVFEEFAASGFIFDFEGSDHPGIAKFYQHFSTTCQPYFKLHFNNLSWLARMFKK